MAVPLRSSNGASSPQFPTNPILERAQSQWFFTPSELLRTPSILEGMPTAQELANRQKGVNFITQVGIMLKLPQLTLSTASVYLHRFFIRHAMALPNKPGLHHYSVAATALFLATKVEENCRKMRELIVACCRVAQKSPNLVVDEQSKEYWKWRDTVLHNEDLLLEALCFDLQLEQPHKILFEFLCYYGVQDNKRLRNASWAFLNDSHVTTLCLLLTPRAIAGSALYAGARLTNVSLPDDDQGRPWWEHLQLDAKNIQRACNLMAEAYENPNLSRQTKEGYWKEDDIFAFDRTRHADSPAPDRSPALSFRSESQGVKREREEADDGQPRNNGHGPSPEDRGAISGGSRSPKRQRRESITGEERPMSGRIPIPTEGRQKTRDTGRADDVQQRIDAIVSASSQTQQSQPSLSRRPSQQPEPGPYERQRSASLTNRPRQPSFHNHDSNARPDSRERPAQRHSRDYEIRDRGDEVPGSRVSQGSKREAEQASQTQAESQEQQPSQSRDMDDAEQVDYGSEEGEL